MALERRYLNISLWIYFATLAGYLAASGPRLSGPSRDNHYVYLAKCLLEGRLSLRGSPPHQNDWALVEELTLSDGRTVRGSFLKTGIADQFKTTKGERLNIPASNIRGRKFVYYVSFPWFPSILMLPFVALFGLSFNDVLFTLFLGAFNPVLLFWVLRRLVELGESRRSLHDDLWIVAMFAFGTVHFYSAVIGQVWYTAHITGVMCTLMYILFSLRARHPMLAGCALACGSLCRTPVPFSFPPGYWRDPA